jgi:hypothetical protein
MSFIEYTSSDYGIAPYSVDKFYAKANCNITVDNNFYWSTGIDQVSVGLPFDQGIGKCFQWDLTAAQPANNLYGVGINSRDVTTTVRTFPLGTWNLRIHDAYDFTRFLQFDVSFAGISGGTQFMFARMGPVTFQRCSATVNRMSELFRDGFNLVFNNVIPGSMKQAPFATRIGNFLNYPMSSLSNLSDESANLFWNLNTGVITIPFDGIYNLHGSLWLTENTTVLITSYTNFQSGPCVYVNGVVEQNFQRISVSNVYNFIISYTRKYKQGDTIEIKNVACANGNIPIPYTIGVYQRFPTFIPLGIANSTANTIELTQIS